MADIEDTGQATCGSKVRRAGPLDGRLSASAGLTIRPAPPAARLVLRAGADAVDAVGAALGLALPVQAAGVSAAVAADGSGAGRHALWLGPDEWLVIDGAGADLAAALSDVTAPHSAVDISHRNTAILVEGAAAKDVLNAGCPLDLHETSFAVGTARRTVFGKAEIVLWRRGPAAFRVECWRSFADHVFMLLAEAGRTAPAAAAHTSAGRSFGSN